MLAACLVLGRGIPICCPPTQIYARLAMRGAVYVARGGLGALVALLGPHAIWHLGSLAQVAPTTARSWSGRLTTFREGGTRYPGHI